MNHRRALLKLMAASPLWSALRGQTSGALADPDLTDPKNAINVMDFEAAARAAIPPAHFAYMATGVDDDATLRANRAGFSQIQLRPRRMVDVTHSNLQIDLFGTRWDSPIFIAPVGSQKAFHAQGEMATAAAAGSRKTLMVLSTVSTSPVEKVAEAAGRAPWFQLYGTSRWDVTEKLVHHAEEAGCPVLVLTVDLTVGRNTETLTRGRKLDSRQCSMCHPVGAQRSYARYPMFNGIDTAGMYIYQSAMTWAFVERLRGITKMKLVLKGIETHEDAQACCEHGVDGIVVSNHGGRAEESGRGTIECLPEIIEAVNGRIPVLIDGGFRRGTDIFKALAIGARAVAIGRPYIWGLGAFGQPGVERVLDLLRTELDLTMRQCGARSVAEITPSFIKWKS